MIQVMLVSHLMYVPLFLHASVCTVPHTQSVERHAVGNQRTLLCRCGKYCLDAAKYTEDTVGPKALQLQFLQRSVGSKFQIEKTVSIPFGTIPEVLDSHYENAGPSTQVRHACAVVEDAGHQLRSKNWKRCR